MKKILVTCNNPGPTTFICEIINNITPHYHIDLIVTNSSKDFIEKRYKEIFTNINVDIYICDDLLGIIKIEEDYNKSSCHNDKIIYNHLYNFILKKKYKLLLRTTPVTEINIDEILPTAARNAGYNGPIVIIQDFYGVGKLLNNNEHSFYNFGGTDLLTVDNYAKQIMKSKFQGNLYIMGWVNHSKYHNKKYYGLINNDIDKSFLGKERILYVCSEVDGEIDIICCMHAVKYALKKNISIIIKFHPRMTKHKKERYINKVLHISSSNELIIFAENLDWSYEEFLTIPNYIISIGSMMSIDSVALNCIIQDMKTKLNPTLNIILRDKRFDNIIEKHLNTLEIPIFNKNQGFLITNLTNFEDDLNKIISDDNLKKNILKEGFQNFYPILDYRKNFIKILKEIEG